MKQSVIAVGGAFLFAAEGLALPSGASGRAAAAALVHSQTARFAIASMTCPTCPITVKIAMRNVPGVQSVGVNLEKKTAVVVFDPSRAKLAAIAAASARVGFPATLVR